MKLNLIINHTSMEPIYEQIVAQIKAEVIEGTLTAGEALPSVRALSRELKISALTVKKAYDNLEEEGLVVTVHGKGSFIANSQSGTFDGRAAQGIGERTGSCCTESPYRGIDGERNPGVI